MTVRRTSIVHGHLPLPSIRIAARVEPEHVPEAPELLYQLRTLDGIPLTVTTHGVIVSVNAICDRLLLGDPKKSTTLHEYIIDAEPSAVSQERVDGFVAGYESKRALSDRYLLRRSDEWRYNYQVGRRLGAARRTKKGTRS